MNRRVVSLLLLPFVLMSQSVTFGHCPGGSHAGHDPRPHIHLNAQSASGKDGRHCRCGHCHRHDDTSQDADEPRSPTPAPSPCHEGSDAVFLSPGDHAVTQREKVDVEDGSSTRPSAVEASPFAPFGDLAPVVRAPFLRPPLAPPPCPLYVRHLSLLI